MTKSTKPVKRAKKQPVVIADGFTVSFTATICQPGCNVNPNEHKLTADEYKILLFIQHGIQGCMEHIAQAAKAGKFVSAAEYQERLILLCVLRDCITNGYHNAKHKYRVVDPKTLARRFLAHLEGE